MECNKALIETKLRETLEMKPDETKIYKCKECTGRKICSYYRARLKCRRIVNGAILSLLIIVILLGILGIKVWLKCILSCILILPVVGFVNHLIIELIKFGKEVKDIVLEANSEITYSDPAINNNDNSGDYQAIPRSKSNRIGGRNRNGGRIWIINATR